MGTKARPKKQLRAKPVFPATWPRDENGEPLFSAQWPRDEHGAFRSVTVTNEGWSAGDGDGAAFGPKQIERAKDEFEDAFGNITLEMGFEFEEIEA